MAEDDREKLAAHIENCRDLVRIMKNGDHRQTVEKLIVFLDAMLAEMNQRPYSQKSERNLWQGFHWRTRRG